MMRVERRVRAWPPGVLQNLPFMQSGCVHLVVSRPNRQYTPQALMLALLRGDLALGPDMLWPR